MNTFNCIKCNTSYQSADAEAYLCSLCLDRKKEIARQIDAKFAALPKKVVESEIARYDRLRGGNRFINSKFL